MLIKLYIYLIKNGSKKFHFLNGISEINQLFDDILII